MNQEDYIKDRVINQIEWYSKKSSWNKHMFYFFSSVVLFANLMIIGLHIEQLLNH